MSKLNLEEQIPGALWVDKERGMYVRREPGDNDRFYACHPESGNQYGYYSTKERAVQDLESLINPSLVDQDFEWVEDRLSRWGNEAHPAWENGWREGAHSGILYERKRVSALLSDERLYEFYSEGRDGVRGILKHIGLDRKK